MYSECRTECKWAAVFDRVFSSLLSYRPNDDEVEVKIALAINESAHRSFTRQICDSKQRTTTMTRNDFSKRYEGARITRRMHIFVFIVIVYGFRSKAVHRSSLQSVSSPLQFCLVSSKWIRNECACNKWFRENAREKMGVHHSHCDQIIFHSFVIELWVRIWCTITSWQSERDHAFDWFI